METLSNIDLTRLPPPPVSHALVLDRHDCRLRAAVYEELVRAGVKAQYQVLSGIR